jgi:GNAT superfamily N-acetyltransferase
MQTLVDKELAYEIAVFKAQILKLYGDAIDDFCIYYEDMFGAILLDIIHLKSEYRKLGLGTEILKKTIEFAANLGVDLVLEPDDCYGTPINVLHHFYAKLGGKLTKINYIICSDKQSKKMFKWTAKKV